MAEVRLEGVSKVFGDNKPVISSLDLTINDGELMALIGPSGCGKSTILRMIAGLAETSEGNILIGGVRVNEMSASERNVAMVFQNYALYPHMTVRKNIDLSLRLAHVKKEERIARVAETAKICGLEDLLNRRPAQLSGGQRQRVAMARAIIRKPKVFLLDEPLSNLDAKLRTQIRTEISDLQKRLFATMVFVTHDQVEAMTMADRVAVLIDGVLQQVGTPKDLYESPINSTVASFIGSPPINLFSGRVCREGGKMLITTASGSNLEINCSINERILNRELIVGLRPEDLDLGSPNLQGLSGKIGLIEPLGAETLVYVDLQIGRVGFGDETLSADSKIGQDLVEQNGKSINRFIVRLPGWRTLRVGDNVVVIAKESARLHLFEPESGMSISTSRESR